MGDGAQHRVAGRVTAEIVDGFEAVDVDEESAPRGRRSLHTRATRRIHALLEDRPVRQIRDDDRDRRLPVDERSDVARPRSPMPAPAVPPMRDCLRIHGRDRDDSASRPSHIHANRGRRRRRARGDAHRSIRVRSVDRVRAADPNRPRKGRPNVMTGIGTLERRADVSDVVGRPDQRRACIRGATAVWRSLDAEHARATFIVRGSQRAAEVGIAHRTRSIVASETRRTSSSASTSSAPRSSASSGAGKPGAPTAIRGISAMARSQFIEANRRTCRRRRAAARDDHVDGLFRQMNQCLTRRRHAVAALIGQVR